MPYAKRELARKRAKEWYREDPKRSKGQRLRQFWPGLSSYEAYDKYQEIAKSQDYKCAICDLPETAKQHNHSKVRDLAVDHRHSDGKVRQLLCGRCNNTLGALKEDPNLFKSFIDYIERHK